MSAFKPLQHRVTIKGRDFHFVAYEGQPASPARKQLAEPPMWCLMVEGRRHAVAPYLPAQPLDAVEKALAVWLQRHVFAAPA